MSGTITLSKQGCVFLPKDVCGFTENLESPHEIAPIENSISPMDEVYLESTWNDYNKLSEIFSELDYEKNCERISIEKEHLISAIEDRILQFPNPFLSTKDEREFAKNHKRLEEIEKEVDKQNLSLVGKLRKGILTLFK